MTEEESSLLFSAGCDAGVVSHCKKTAEIADGYRGVGIDSKLVHSGAYLHDLGRSKTHSIRHAGVGAELARTYGLSEEIRNIIQNHTGAGLSEDDCVLLNLPPCDCVPKTFEEKIVAHADNLAKGSKQVRIEQRMMLISDQSHRSKKNVWRLAMEVELFRV
ncbi:MAG TPA: HDIG domain-containing protein [Methanocorpusculum sp.]|nr:HDIG domain-containing protein [Methanocorpusculum sp.]